MKIVLIDRYPSSGRAVASVLQRHRPEYHFCGQAYTQEAGRQLVAQQDPDVVILEPLLFSTAPQTMQTELTQLKHLCPEAKLIVTTASSSSEHIRAALRVGVEDYLYKPLQWHELLSVLDRCHGGLDRETDYPLQPQSGVEAIQSIVLHIQHGNAEDALSMLEGEFHGGQDALAYSERCIRYMDIATQVIHLPDSIDHVPEDLGALYQQFIKSSSRHRDVQELDHAMATFVRRSAEIFNLYAKDQGYHQIQEAKRFVDEHLGEDLSLKRISGELYISTTYFSRLFRAKTGMKFSEYLAQRRIERAKVLLTTTDLPVMEVARQVGYTEANSFARLFKGHTGKTPAQYRKGRA